MTVREGVLDDAEPVPSAPADLWRLWRYLTVTARPRRRSVLFCFGSSYLGVARRAAALFRRGLAPWVLVTGGGRGRVAPYATEADAFAHVLREGGVPPERIVVERRARNTGENVSFGMRALTGRGIPVSTVGLVAWPTSLRRCEATFARQFPRVGTTPYPAFEGFGPYAGAPTVAMAAVLAELFRLREYPRHGYTVPQPMPPSIVRAETRLREWVRVPAR